MDIRQKMEQAFKVIQSDPELWKAWHSCIHRFQRDAMLAQALWDIAFREGQQYSTSKVEE
jgi:hypothetical protein